MILPSALLTRVVSDCNALASALLFNAVLISFTEVIEGQDCAAVRVYLPGGLFYLGGNDLRSGRSSHLTGTTEQLIDIVRTA